MAKRITNMKVVLFRAGTRVVVPANKMFDFTKEELDDLKAINKDAVRTPRNEVEDVAEIKAPETPPATTNKGGSGNKGGGNKATAPGAATDANEL